MSEAEESAASHDEEKLLEGEIEKEVKKLKYFLEKKGRFDSTQGLCRNGNRQQTSGQNYRQTGGSNFASRRIENRQWRVL